MSRRDNLVSVEEHDYLTEDDKIRGQEYVLMSFVSPEKILKDKEVFIFEKFTKNFTKEIRELFENMMIKYPDETDTFKSLADKYRYLFVDGHMQEEYKYFRDEKSEDINKEYDEVVDFQTHVRGFKVRGCYDTHRAAQVRSEVLKRKDKKHNIFICTVGCWCPWDPSPDLIEDQHYSEDSLNTLMKKYNENQSYKDDVFDDRKDDLINDQKEKVRRSKIAQGGEKANLDMGETSETTLLLKDAEANANDVNEIVDDVVSDAVSDVVNTTGLGDNNEVKDNIITDSGSENMKLNKIDDPWVKRQKLREKLVSDGLLPKNAGAEELQKIITPVIPEPTEVPNFREE